MRTETVRIAGPDKVVVGEAGELSYVEASRGWPVTHNSRMGRADLQRRVDGYPEIVPFEPPSP